MCDLNGPILKLSKISKLYFDGTISEKSPNGAFTCKSCLKNCSQNTQAELKIKLLNWTCKEAFRRGLLKKH
jgi:hypothetical protein